MRLMRGEWKMEKPCIPVALSREEIDAIPMRLSPPCDLVVKLLYGCGLRLSEPLAKARDGKKARALRIEYEGAVYHVTRGVIDQGKPPALPVDSQSLRFAGVVIPAVFLSRNPGS